MNNNYNRRGNRGNYNNNYQPQNNGYQAPPPKKSGAKAGMTKHNKMFVAAWNASKDKGLIVVSAFENSRSTHSESQTGNKFITMMFEIQYRKSGNRLLELANYNVTTGKVYLQKLGMVISTKAARGGYFGRIARK